MRKQTDYQMKVTLTIMLENWEQRWENNDMGTYTFFIYPHVDLHLWFSGLAFSSLIITKIYRLTPNHARVKSYLNRIT
jgi:hypothetical protein